jgi:hypothetical protein
LAAGSRVADASQNSMTALSLPTEYSSTGLSLSATTSRMM